MILKIKSIENIKNIFSYVKEVIKLGIIINNKELQQKLKINIDNYKSFSNKILTIDEEGNGEIRTIKEHTLYFKGKYLNKKKNGYGIEYSQIHSNCSPPKNLQKRIISKTLIGLIPNKIKFKKYIYLYYEGEYVNGKKEGKGKEYDMFRRIGYEGEYKKGKKEGYGKEFDKDDIILYEGEFKNGKRDGKGKEYDNKGTLIFEGEFKKGEKEGKGKEYDNKGIIRFECEYKNNKRSGFGYVKEYDSKGNLSFEGEYKFGYRNGKGKEYDKDGNVIFEGEYIWKKKFNS